MRFGFFLNTYPGTSMTFIRTEIAAIETRFSNIPRYAIRRWDQPLVTAEDKHEQAKTRYILDAPVKAVLRVLAEAVQNPAGMARAVSSLVALYRSAGHRPLAHMAYLAEAVTLKRWARQDKVTHLHTHFSTNSAAITLLCRRLGGPTYSFTAHGPNEFYEDNRPSIPLKVRYASFVSCISAYCEARIDDICQGLAKGKTHIVRCGIDLPSFTATPPLGPDAPLVCVGRLCPEKAQLVTVEAISRIVETHPNLRFQFIGDGEDRAAIEQRIAELGLQDQISLVGWKSQEEVRRLIREARAFVLPSFAEGLPIVFMEALALGRPVVATPVAGIPELVTPECGWLVEPGDIDGLANALEKVLSASPEEMDAKSKAGRARVEQMHDGNENALGLSDLLMSHVREPHTSPSSRG